MASIEDKIAQIRQALFGKDVRENIASGIEAINNEVESTTQKQTTLEDNMNNLADDLNAAENTRVSSENARVSNEQDRATAESSRVTEFNNMKTAYDAATHENTAVELTDARHDSVNNADYPNIGARFNNIASSMNDFKNEFAYCKKLFSKLDNGQSATIVFLGDSTTQQNNTTDPNPNSVGQITSWLQGIYGTDKVTVINSGVGGDDSSEGWQRTYKDVVKYKPDLVVICFGLNDVAVPFTTAQFKTYYKNIIEQILSICGSDTDIICRTPNMFNDINHVSHPQIQAYNAALKQLCNVYGIAFADFWAYEYDLVTNKGVVLNTLMYDITHPNYLGHQYIANFLKNFIVPSQRAYTRVLNLEVLDNFSPLISTVGNFAIDGSVGDNYFNGKAMVGTSSGAKLTVKFYGIGLSFFYLKTNNQGQIKLTLDGTVIESAFELYQATTTWLNSYDIDNLVRGEHTLVIEILATKNVSSTGYIAQIHAFVIKDVHSAEAIAFRKVWQKNSENILNASLSANGWRRNPDGTLEQWGYKALSKGGTLTFPKAFKTNDYRIFFQHCYGTTLEAVGIDTGNSANYTAIDCKPIWNSADATKGIFWRAIGDFSS